METFWNAVKALCEEENVSDIILRPGKKLQFNCRAETLVSTIMVSSEAFDQVAVAVGGDLPERTDRDGSFKYDDLRFRVNYFRSRGEPKMVMRLLPNSVPTPDSVRLPEALVKAGRANSSGLILVCGPTGSGKSTTLAALISIIMRERAWHLITIEDPIEYPLAEDPVFGSRVTARQIGLDIPDFATGLRSALRQAPKAILVGEIRDPETAEMALNAALTGHLVFSTLHTNSAALTCDRFSQLFPAEKMAYATSTFADVFKCLVCQQLAPSLDGHSRVALHEILMPTPSVARLIRERQFPDLINEIETGRSYGHQSFKHAHERAVSERLIAKRPNS